MGKEQDQKEGKKRGGNRFRGGRRRREGKKTLNAPPFALTFFFLKFSSFLAACSIRVPRPQRHVLRTLATLDIHPTASTSSARLERESSRVETEAESPERRIFASPSRRPSEAINRNAPF